MNKQKIERIGEINYNNQGCLMKIVEYKNTKNIVVEFQDDYKERVYTQYDHFKNKSVRNPYCLNSYGGRIGAKYPSKINGKQLKEYTLWINMLIRCFDAKFKERNKTYENVTCCEDWLLYENFYEWLHSQENFEKWLNNENWHLDKDILHKENKIYSPETCCLVPQNVNCLFTKNNISRNNLPVGVVFEKIENKYRALCSNPFTGKRTAIGRYDTPEKAFYLGYKPYKEDVIKRVAQEEYDVGNITEKCYKAMMNYKVEITD